MLHTPAILRSEAVATPETAQHPRYRLFLLGGASVIGPDGPVDAVALDNRLIALLALLATAPPGVPTREALLRTLWPGVEPSDADPVLEGDLQVLRTQIDPGVIHEVGGALALDPSVLWCDVVSYRAHLQTGDRLSAAADYQGPFLDRFHLADAAAFNQWMHSERAAFALAFRKMAAALAAEAMAGRDGQAAARWWTRLVDADPWNPNAALQAMDGFEAMGEPAAAMAVAEEFLTRTHQRLGRTADPGVTERLSRLRQAPPPGRRHWGGIAAGVAAVLVVVLLLILL